MSITRRGFFRFAAMAGAAATVRLEIVPVLPKLAAAYPRQVLPPPLVVPVELDREFSSHIGDLPHFMWGCDVVRPELSVRIFG